MAAPSAPTGPWLTTRALNPQARLRLFCFPYAGGNAAIFRKWQDAFPPSTGVEICPVQLPGRGSRIHEPPFSELSPLVEAAATALQPHFDRPFAFFGHSMGAIIAFETARLLRRTHREEPTRLIVSGRRAPHVPSDEPPTYNLPDDEFVEELRRLNGTPRQVLEHPELMQLMLPLVRADFAVTQTYVHKEEPPLRCPFTVFGGIEDTDAGGESLSRWCELTKGACSVKIFEGGHFFINTSEARLLQVLKQELLRHELP